MSLRGAFFPAPHLPWRAVQGTQGGVRQGNNAKHLTYFEQARVAYMLELGLFTKDQSFMEIGVILADIHITYLAPIYYGEQIKVGVHAAKLGNKSMTWLQNIVDVKTGKELGAGVKCHRGHPKGSHRDPAIDQSGRCFIKAFEKV